MSYSTANS